MEWNSQSLAPVRASYARESPGGPIGISPTVAPSMTTFLKIAGTPFHGTSISTMPSLPKPGSILPEFAFRPTRCGPAVNMIRGGLLASPGQNATPRAVVANGNCAVQTSLPDSGSSAITRRPAGRYIRPLTTIGVASGFALGPPRPPPRPRPAASAAKSPLPAGAAASAGAAAGAATLSLKLQASVSFETFPALICLSGE